MSKGINSVIVNKGTSKFSAVINEKTISMTFDELNKLMILINRVLNDYTGKALGAYEDENGKITLI